MSRSGMKMASMVAWLKNYSVVWRVPKGHEDGSILAWLKNYPMVWCVPFVIPAFWPLRSVGTLFSTDARIHGT